MASLMPPYVGQIKTEMVMVPPSPFFCLHMFIMIIFNDMIISNPTEVSVKISDGDWYAIMPKGSLIATMDESDIISLKVLASRKTIFTIDWRKVTSPQASSKEDLFSKLQNLL